MNTIQERPTVPVAYLEKQGFLTFFLVWASSGWTVGYLSWGNS